MSKNNYDNFLIFDRHIFSM